MSSRNGEIQNRKRIFEQQNQYIQSILSLKLVTTYFTKLAPSKKKRETNYQIEISSATISNSLMSEAANQDHPYFPQKPGENFDAIPTGSSQGSTQPSSQLKQIPKKKPSSQYQTPQKPRWRPSDQPERIRPILFPRKRHIPRRFNEPVNSNRLPTYRWIAKHKTHKPKKPIPSHHPQKPFNRLPIFKFFSSVCSHLEHSRATFHQCINLFNKLTNIPNRHLTAVTCFMLASKLLEHHTNSEYVFGQAAVYFKEERLSLEEVVEGEEEVLLEVGFRVDSKTVLEGLEQVLEKWDSFVTGYNEAELVMGKENFYFMRKEKAVQNYLEMTIFLDRLLVIGALKNVQASHQFTLHIICGIFIIYGLKIGQITLQKPCNQHPKHHKLTHKILTQFTCKILPTLSPSQLDKTLQLALTQVRVLRTLPQALQRIQPMLQGCSYKRHLHLHVRGIYQ